MSWLGDFISAPFKSIGSLVGDITGTNEANRINTQMTREQMKWQSGEAALNRDFQDQQRIAQNQWSEDQYNKYNSPQAVVNQYRQAGVNPAALYSSGSSSPAQANMTAGSPGQGSMPSGVSFPGAHRSDIIGGLMSVSSIFKELASARKMGAETDRISKLIGLEAENMLLKNVQEGTRNEILSVEKYVKNHIKDDEIKSAYYNWQKSAAQVLNTQADTDLKEWQSITEQFKQTLLDRQSKMSEAEYNALCVRVDNMQRVIDSEVELNKARKSESYASAESHRAAAENQRAQAEGQKIFNQLHDNPYFREAYVNRATAEVREIESRIRKNNKDVDFTDKQIDHLCYLITQAAYADDMKEFSYWSSQINGFIGTLGSAASQFYGAGALRELINLRRMEQNKPTVPLESGRGFYMDGGLIYKQPW